MSTGGRDIQLLAGKAVIKEEEEEKLEGFNWVEVKDIWVEEEEFLIKEAVIIEKQEENCIKYEKH
jgi:hypothetical protein